MFENQLPSVGSGVALNTYDNEYDTVKIGYVYSIPRPLPGSSMVLFASPIEATTVYGVWKRFEVASTRHDL